MIRDQAEGVQKFIYMRMQMDKNVPGLSESKRMKKKVQRKLLTVVNF